MNLSVIIVNYNSEKELGKYFFSIYKKIKEEDRNSEFIIIDNHSSDGSVFYLKEHFPEVKIIEEKENLFFGPAANKAIKLANHKLVLLLNPDVDIEKLGLSKIIDQFKSNEKLFSLNPFIFDPRDSRQENLFAFAIKRGLIDVKKSKTLKSSGNTEIPYPIGGAVFLRRNLFLELGGFDELFSPFYWEDTELGIRACRKGYEHIYFPESRFMHYRSTIIRRHYEEDAIKAIYERNRLIVMWKHLPLCSPLFVSHLFFLPLRVVSSLFKDKSFFRGFLLFVRQIRPVLKRRKEDKKIVYPFDFIDVLSKFGENA
jgi:GT2 family glycosyltransferase